MLLRGAEFLEPFQQKGAQLRLNLGRDEPYAIKVLNVNLVLQRW